MKAIQLALLLGVLAIATTTMARDPVGNFELDRDYEPPQWHLIGNEEPNPAEGEQQGDDNGAVLLEVDESFKEKLQKLLQKLHLKSKPKNGTFIQVNDDGDDDWNDDDEDDSEVVEDDDGNVFVEVDQSFKERLQQLLSKVPAKPKKLKFLEVDDTLQESLEQADKFNFKPRTRAFVEVEDDVEEDDEEEDYDEDEWLNAFLELEADSEPKTHTLKKRLAVRKVKSLGTNNVLVEMDASIFNKIKQILEQAQAKLKLPTKIPKIQK